MYRSSQLICVGFPCCCGFLAIWIGPPWLLVSDGGSHGVPACHDAIRGIFVLLAIAIVGSILMPLTSLIAKSADDVQVPAFLLGLLLVNNVADGASVGGLGIAVVLRACALTSVRYHRYLYLFIIAYAAYVAVVGVKTLAHVGKIFMRRQILTAAIFIVNLLVTLNTLAIELYVLRQLKRSSLASVQALMFANFTTMVVDCAMGFAGFGPRVTTLMIVFTSSHIFAFCALNDTVMRAISELAETCADLAMDYHVKYPIARGRVSHVNEPLQYTVP